MITLTSDNIKKLSLYKPNFICWNKFYDFEIQFISFCSLEANFVFCERLKDTQWIWIEISRKLDRKKFDRSQSYKKIYFFKYFISFWTPYLYSLDNKKYISLSLIKATHFQVVTQNWSINFQMNFVIRIAYWTLLKQVWSK
jgi:hypothetical protein